MSARRFRRRRPGRWAAALAVVLAGPAGPAAGAATCSVPGREWTAYGTPVYHPVTDPPFVSYPTWSKTLVATRGNPNRVYVSNGERVFRSDDSGCRWTPVLSLGPEGAATTNPFLPALSRIVELVTSPRGDDPNTVYALVGPRRRDGDGGALFDYGVPFYSDVDPVSQAGAPQALYVLKSVNAGNTWQLRVPGAVFGGGQYAVSPDGVPLAAHEPRLTIAPDDSRTLYLWNPRDGLWASRDGAATFARQAGVAPLAEVTDDAAGCCAVDPLDARDVWGSWQGHVHRSRDGGRTATAVLTGEAEWIDVWHRPARPAEVVLQLRTGELRRSTDGGRTFRPLLSPKPRTAANGPALVLGSARGPGGTLYVRVVWSLPGLFVDSYGYGVYRLDAGSPPRWTRLAAGSAFLGLDVGGRGAAASLYALGGASSGLGAFAVPLQRYRRRV